MTQTNTNNPPAHLKLCNYEQALTDASMALHYHPTHLKVSIYLSIYSLYTYIYLYLCISISPSIITPHSPEAIYLSIYLLSLHLYISIPLTSIYIYSPYIYISLYLYLSIYPYIPVYQVLPPPCQCQEQHGETSRGIGRPGDRVENS